MGTNRIPPSIVTCVASILGVLVVQDSQADPHPESVRFHEDAAIVAIDHESSVPPPKPDVVRFAATIDTLAFAAGPRRVPDWERVEPELVTRSGTAFVDDRPNAETYGFIVFSNRQFTASLERLASLGVRSLGYFPYHALKVAIPTAAIPALMNEPNVRWVGRPRAIDKASPQLATYLLETPTGRPLELFVSLFESDSNPNSIREPRGMASGWDATAGPSAPRIDPERGAVWQSRGWQQRALERLGVTISGYEPNAVAFHAEVPAEVLPDVLACDFVLAVEPATRPTTGHEESMPMIHADATRSTWGGQFSNAIAAGVIDSGVRATHEAIVGHQFWGFDLTGAGNPWLDQCNGGQGHGTHVFGTLLGNPPGNNARRRGVAPYLGGSTSLRVRSTRVFGVGCAAAGGTYDSWFSTMRGNVDDGAGGISPPPVVVNNSWGSAPATPAWKGTELAPRTIDAEIWNQNQVYVFISQNYGPAPGSMSPEGAAKNSLVVGNVVDCYDIGQGAIGIHPHRVWTGAQASGQGPCGDGRWKPNVVAPGHWVTSAGANADASYVQYNGTSMAAPHLSGLVAQLADHFPELRFAPHRMAAHVMASAMPFQGQAFSFPAPAWANQYGVGRIESLRAHGLEPDSTIESWAVSLSAGQGATGDFTVPPGATRVVIVLTWIEPAASAAAAKAVINDLDLYLDLAPFSTGTNTGEWSSESGVDNTEVRTLLNPTSGTYRWKIHPFLAPSSSRAAVAVSIQRGSASPVATLDVSVSDAFVKPSETTTIEAVVGASGAMLSAAYLDTVTSTGATKLNTRTTLRDGVVTNLTSNFSAAAGQSGFDILLGDIAASESRTGTYDVRWTTPGLKTWNSQLISENHATIADSVTVTVDGTAPPAPDAVGSSTHVPGVWSNDPTITFTWNQAPDSLSGVVGYSYLIGASATVPDESDDLGITASFATTLASPQQGDVVFSLRAIDACGNVSATGSNPIPFRVDFTPPTSVSVTVDSGAPSTPDSVVVLTIQAVDAESGPFEMRFRNDGGAFSPWEPFANTKAWDLIAYGGSLQTGTRTVTAEVRDHAGNSVESEDSVYWYHAVEYGGTACSGAMGVPNFAILGTPGWNSMVTFSVSQSDATHGLLYLGLSTSTWAGAPLPFAIGLSGCSIDVSLDFLMYSGGLIPIPAVIPPNPLVVGLPLHFQWLLTGDSSGKPVVTTQRATMTISGP